MVRWQAPGETACLQPDARKHPITYWNDTEERSRIHMRAIQHLGLEVGVTRFFLLTRTNCT